MILLLIAFVAGFLTVLAPCVLPLLPVIIGGSVVKSVSHRNSKYTIIFSLAISVILFTFLLKVSTAFVNVPQNVWAYISGAIIVLLGFTFLFENIWTELMGKLGMATWANKLLGTGLQKKSFWGDVIMGAALGPVFSTCSPTYFLIIATVLPVSIAKGSIYLLSYVIGLSIALFLIALLGEKIMGAFNAASNPHSLFKKIMGIIFIILGIFIFTGYEAKLEAGILGSGFFDVTTIEQKLLAPKQAPQNTQQTSPQISNSPQPSLNVREGAAATTYTLPPFNNYPAPELVSPDAYINTNNLPITIAQFKGKKDVLIDFWTYSCINCQRTIPHVEAWYNTYSKDGLEVISVHTPEFSFEHNLANVQKAVQSLGITYPVVLDNEYKTWNAFGNQFWPMKYLIDINGNVVYTHAGEGDYDITENAIKATLQKDGLMQGAIASAPAVPDVESTSQTPEIYFGSNRNPFEQNITLGGKWNITGEYASPTDVNETVTLDYHAKNVYMVAGSSTPANVDVYIDGIKNNTVTISDQKLYTLYSGTSGQNHTLELKIPNNQNLQLFTFTFG